MKKHIAQTVMALLLLVSVFFLSKEGAQLANGTPKESKGVIVVDSGHGGIDPGVIGQNELKEKEINLAIAKKLQERLEDAQINVIMTRDTDDDLSVESDKSKKKADLERRCDIINSSGADMVISIHQNSYVTPKAEGAQVFYYSHSAEGHTAAKLMQQALLGADSENTRQE
mgnify:CR=1 FL=1